MLTTEDVLAVIAGVIALLVWCGFLWDRVCDVLTVRQERREGHPLGSVLGGRHPQACRLANAESDVLRELTEK